MSLLSDTAHTPERILSLLKLVEVLGEDALRDNIRAIMDPTDAQKVAFDQTVGAAASLGLVTIDALRLRLSVAEVPESHAGFADLCYELLLEAATAGSPEASEADGNALLLAAFSLVALKSDQSRSSSWFPDDLDRDEFSSDVRQALSAAAATEGAFNTTRFVPWRRWMHNLGLLEEVERDVYFPDVARRLRAEIVRSGLDQRGTQPARDFVAWVRMRMPFLPGGRLFTNVTGQTARAGECGVLLSAALRSLRDEGILTLNTVGDSAGQVTLAHDDADAARSFSEISFPDRRGQ